MSAGSADGKRSGKRRSLRSLRVLVTAGPTLEPIDPVRFFSNRSTGVFGYAIAQESARRGDEVTLVSGPTALKSPSGVRLIRVETAGEMERALNNRFPSADVLFMTAAVSDFKPVRISREKIRRGAGGLVVRLMPTRDIVSGLPRREGQQVVGFCLESSQWVDRARRKLQQKKLDWVVANSTGPVSPFGSGRTSVVILSSQGEQTRLMGKTKREIARRLLNLVEKRISGGVPKGLRERSAKPLFTGSSPVAASHRCACLPG